MPSRGGRRCIHHGARDVSRNLGDSASGSRRISGIPRWRVARDPGVGERPTRRGRRSRRVLPERRALERSRGARFPILTHPWSDARWGRVGLSEGPGSGASPRGDAESGPDRDVMPSQPKTVIVGGVTLHLSSPDATEQGWIGQDADPPAAPGLLAGRRPERPAARPRACSGPPGHRQDDAGDGRRPPPRAAALHQPVHRRHPARRPARHARARRVGQDRLPRLAAGLGDAHRRRLRARRGEPDEREVVGQPGPAARPPPLRRERRGRASRSPPTPTSAPA